MLGEFFGWIRWVWSRQETWQKWWLFAMFWLGAGLSASHNIQPYIMAIPALIFGFYLTKWAVWDAFRSSWAKYRQHRNELLTTIKDSDK